MSNTERKEPPPPRPPLQPPPRSSSSQQGFEEQPTPGKAQSPTLARKPLHSKPGTAKAQDQSAPSSKEGQLLPPSQADPASQPQKPVADPASPDSWGWPWDITEEEERLLVEALDEFESQAKLPKY